MTTSVSALKPSGQAFTPELVGSGLKAKIRNAFWGLAFLLRYGRPTGRVFRFGGGLGDHLLVSSVFRELQGRQETGNWMLSDHPDIFLENPDISRVIPDNWRTEKFCEKLGYAPTTLSYGTWINDPDQIVPPKKHIIAEILERAGIAGDVELRPYFPAVQTVSPELHSQSDTVCIQGANTASTTPMLNKQWSEKHFEEVGSMLSCRYKMVQLGLPGESDISAAEDLRGALSIIQTAEMLAQSRFFIGQVGFLMHLARAVGTRSIIVYGGREKAWQSGYPCNENLETNPGCAPCWRNSGCEYDRKCLSDITVQNLLDAVDRMESRLEQPLETKSITLP